MVKKILKGAGKLAGPAGIIITVLFAPSDVMAKGVGETVCDGVLDNVPLVSWGKLVDEDVLGGEWVPSGSLGGVGVVEDPLPLDNGEGVRQADGSRPDVAPLPYP